MLHYTPISRTEITSVRCPNCQSTVQGIGLMKGSDIKGLTFRCRKCSRIYEVTSTARPNILTDETKPTVGHAD